MYSTLATSEATVIHELKDQRGGGESTNSINKSKWGSIKTTKDRKDNNYLFNWMTGPAEKLSEEAQQSY